jgi:hypothetical protein
MPIFEVTSPDGKTFEINAPDGATQEQALAYAQQQFSKLPSSQVEAAKSPEKKSYGWSDVPLEALSNLGSSTANLVQGIAGAVTSPIETGKAILDVGSGAMVSASPAYEQFLLNTGSDTPEELARVKNVASNAGEFFKNRYGSSEGVKTTLAEDPVGAVADLSTVLTGGGAAASKLARTQSKLGKILSQTGKILNPLSPLEKVTGSGMRFVGNTGANILGKTTGAGAESIVQAAKANPAVMRNMTGQAEMTDVLDMAKDSLNRIKIAKNADYSKNMTAMAKDKKVLDFNDIDTSLQNAQSAGMYKGQIKNEYVANKVQEATDAVNDWKNLNPAEFHTPEGLDQLKQKIGSIAEGIPLEQKSARRAINDIYGSLRSTIAKQAPIYDKTMRDYSKASELVTEIEKSLSLGNKATTDTAMRKLQSLTRNNASTNYGQRVNLVKELEKYGGQDIMPSLAGQALSEWTPRGIGGALTGLSIPAAIINPKTLAALPLFSPRLVGSAVYGGGKAVQGARSALSKIPLTLDEANQAALLAYQANNGLL